MNEKERKQYKINLALEEYLDTPEEQRSLTKLGQKYGIKRQTLSKHLKDRGYEVINYQNRLRCNETVFDKIDNEEASYWLGFLYADGNISSVGNRLEVHLSIKDLSHLEKFRRFLNLSTEIRSGIDSRGYGFCHLSIRNKHLWNTLNNLGCHPQKSLNLKFPNQNIFKGDKKELMKHFIRGYIDGDGCLSIFKNKNSYRTELGLVGTKEFLEYVNKLFKNKGYIRNKSCKNWENKAYDLRFSDVPSRIIARFLYENSNIYLERKYNKYLEFCSLEDESPLRKSSKIGGSCDGNTEVSSGITKGSETLQSVEGE